jgi:hypothetical protein
LKLSSFLNIRFIKSSFSDRNKKGKIESKVGSRFDLYARVVGSL